MKRRARRAPLFLATLVILSSLCLAGCFTADITVGPDGGGTIEYMYLFLPTADIEKEKARFTSPHVTLVSYTPKPSDHTAVVVAKFDDVTKLNTAEGFKYADLSRSRDGDTERMRIVLRNPNPDPSARDEHKDGPRIALTLPGKVIEANRNAEVAGDRVTWRIPVIDFQRTSSLELTVSWTAAPAPAGATSTTEPSKETGSGH